MRNYENACELACEVGKLPLPPAVVSDVDQVCALTGTLVPAGVEGLVPWQAGVTFRDQYDIVDRQSSYVAQHTAAILERPYMQKYSKSVISPDGWFKFATTHDVAWFLLNPPTPPFVMIFGIAKMEHLLWRTPLSLSRELFFVRLGHRLLRINHARLLAIHATQASCVDAVNDWCEAEQRKPINAPFLPIGRELNIATSGMVHPALLDAAEAGIQPAADYIAQFRELSSGELWALGRIHAARSLTLTAPEPLEFNHD